MALTLYWAMSYVCMKDYFKAYNCTELALCKMGIIWDSNSKVAEVIQCYCPQYHTFSFGSVCMSVCVHSLCSKIFRVETIVCV